MHTFLSILFIIGLFAGTISLFWWLAKDNEQNKEKFKQGGMVIGCFVVIAIIFSIIGSIANC